MKLKRGHEMDRAYSWGPRRVMQTSSQYYWVDGAAVEIRMQ